MRLAGNTWEEMLALDRDMLHVRFPRIANEEKGGKEPKDPEEIEPLRRAFEESREYGRLRDLARDGKAAAVEFDPRLEALVPFARGQKPVALHASNAATILRALPSPADLGLKSVLYGASGWKVAAEIAREKVPVAVGPVLALPNARQDPTTPATPARPCSRARGVSDRDQCGNARTRATPLAFHAAMACAFGLHRTRRPCARSPYYPARILGMVRDFRLCAASRRAGKVAA
jgi:hypothetical protein